MTNVTRRAANITTPRRAGKSRSEDKTFAAIDVHIGAVHKLTSAHEANDRIEDDKGATKRAIKKGLHDLRVADNAEIKALIDIINLVPTSTEGVLARSFYLRNCETAFYFWPSDEKLVARLLATTETALCKTLGIKTPPKIKPATVWPRLYSKKAA